MNTKKILISGAVILSISTLLVSTLFVSLAVVNNTNDTGDTSVANKITSTSITTSTGSTDLNGGGTKSSGDVYNIILNETYLTSHDIFVRQGAQIHSAPGDGKYSFYELYNEQGLYSEFFSKAFSANQKKNSATLQAVHVNNKGTRQIIVKFRFHKNAKEWWLNSIWMQINFKTSLITGTVNLTSINGQKYATQGINQQTINEVFNSSIGKKLPLGTEFTQNRLEVPLYKFSPTKRTIRAKWGEFDITNPHLLAFNTTGKTPTPATVSNQTNQNNQTPTQQDNNTNNNKNVPGGTIPEGISRFTP